MFINKNVKVPEFYAGKSIFLTGCTGFLGSVLLEKLLRCCPGIVTIYVLIRGRRGVNPETRIRELFQKKKIFKVLRDTSPEMFSKVIIVKGDLSEIKLGLSHEDLDKLIQNVNIVFHNGASISFLKPLKFILTCNSSATNAIVDICKQMRNLEALVYTSTAYSNCNILGEVIEEKIYHLPFESHIFLDVIEDGNEKRMKNLLLDCEPKWVNNYTFSKCLSENILAEKAADLPVVIVRPAIIGTVYKGPVPGYVEKGTAVYDITVGVGKGVIRVIFGHPSMKMDMVPADVVANILATGAWSVATKRLSSPLIVNVSAWEGFSYTLYAYIKVMMKFCTDHPVPNLFQKPSVMISSSYLSYRLNTILHHYVPGYFIDAVLSLMGKKLRLVPIYKMIDKAAAETRYFMSHTWKYQLDNFRKIDELLDPDDKEDFYVDQTGYKLEKDAYNLVTGSPVYEEIDNRSPRRQQRDVFMLTMLIKFIKLCAVVLFGLLIYYICYFFTYVLF